MKRFLSACAMFALLAPHPASAATVLTGDRIDGVAVIEKLDVADVPAGQISRFYFRVTDQAAGQGWYVPVLVARGARPGKRLLLTAAIHGDELNGIDVIHRLFADLDPRAMQGTVVAIPGLNAPGILNATRGFTPGGAASGANLNRLMPGDVHADDVAAVYAGRLWDRLFVGNADVAIDMHTQSRGTVYPMYVFVETDAARRIAELLRPDVIKLDPGVKGTVENTLNPAGVTAVTLELGGPERFEAEMVRRGLRGVRNVMQDMGIVAGAPDMSGPAPYVGAKSVNVVARRGGYARILVALGEDVKAGQTVATISDPFGRVVETLASPVAGRVSSLATAPTREIGDLLVRVLQPAGAAK
jgi:uncharacterized protein